MSRILPYPILSLVLFLLWLLLQQSVSPGNIVMGLAVGLIVGKITSALEPDKPRFRRPWLIPKLLGIIIYDIVRSNLAVAWIILTRGRQLRTSGFLKIPLDLRDRTALAALAVILTATPGTVWLEFDAERGDLLIHVLDLVDEQHWIDIIKTRYERLLLEIFA